MKPSERYRRDAEDLRKFRDAFVRLFALQQRKGWKGTSTWRKTREPAALASGPAAEAFDRHNGGFVDANPVAAWAMSLEESDRTSPDDVLAAVDAAIARAERASEDTQQRERGLTGLVAAFLRWPSTLREAVDPTRVGQARAAAAIGYVAQVLVGVVASLIAAGLIRLGASVFG